MRSLEITFEVIVVLNVISHFPGTVVSFPALDIPFLVKIHFHFREAFVLWLAVLAVIAEYFQRLHPAFLDELLRVIVVQRIRPDTFIALLCKSRRKNKKEYQQKVDFRFHEDGIINHSNKCKLFFGVPQYMLINQQ